MQRPSQKLAVELADRRELFLSAPKDHEFCDLSALCG